ncbi:YraN family protein [Massilia sp. W12]|uniref:YraN family protein n=1 Tax=Massilia sp. W12 TaxID=3126507 RepID=UPI0030D2B6F2
MDWLALWRRVWPQARAGNAGAQAEDAALRWLQQRGLRLLTRNYRCRRGEIDLVMQDGACVVFVEVRQRSSAWAGGAAASVDRAKQRRLQAAAAHWLQRQKRMPNCRFDLLALDGEQVQWIKNIIQAE